MKNLSLIRRFTIGSMVLGLAVPMLYHASLNLTRFDHFRTLTRQVCRAIEPRIQIGAQREALEYLVSAVTSQGHEASPEVVFKDHGNFVTQPVRSAGSKFYESCKFQGITGVEVGIYYNQVPLFNISYLYLYLLSVPLLFLVFMWARRGIIRLQRKVADIIESQMKQLFGMGLSTGPQKTSLFYKLFDLEIPLLKYLKKHIENLEADLKDYSQKIADQQKREVLMDVAAQMAHEIVTPISTLQTIIQNGDAKENQNLLLMELTQIKTLSERLLREYRGEPPTQSQQNEKIDVISNLKSVIESVKIFSKGLHPVLIDFKYDPQDKFEIIGDRSQFIAALSNILRNSVEALDKSESSIRIRFLKNSDYRSLIISDNGCGIKEENLKKVFENKVSIGKKNGTGIGLYQVQSTLQNMGGKIEIESKVNTGTTVKLSWPLAQTELTPRLSKNPDLILIDDKKSNHIAWDIHAKRAQKTLRTFFSHQEFLLSTENFDKSTPIFVDYLFENEAHSGNAIAEKIMLAGYKNVHISTGLPADRVIRPTGVKSVVGKDFPTLSLL